MNRISKKFTAVIAAAGRGSRMGALGSRYHKLFLPLDNTRITNWEILSAITANFAKKNIYVVYGSRPRQFRKTLRPSNKKVTLVYNRHFRSKHCGSSICRLGRKLKGPLVFFTSDIVFSKSNAKLISKVLRRTSCQENIVFTVPQGDRYVDFQRIQSDGNCVGEWDTGLAEWDNCVCGPIVLGEKATEDLVERITKDSDELSNIPCFSVFSRLLEDFPFRIEQLNFTSVSEIDTARDYLLFRRRRKVLL